MIPPYIRRASEIQFALLVDYLYYEHKNMQSMIDYFVSTAKVLNVPNTELISTAVINFKKLLPTARELVSISQLSISRNKFIHSKIINNKLGRNSIYNMLKELPYDDDPNDPDNRIIRIDLTLKSPITMQPVTDTLIQFLDKYQDLCKNVTAMYLKGFENNV